MLDLLEWLGMDFDGMDAGQSVRWRRRLFGEGEEESVCSYLVRKRRYILVALIGWYHCHRSHARYRS